MIYYVRPRHRGRVLRAIKWESNWLFFGTDAEMHPIPTSYSMRAKPDREALIRPFVTTTVGLRCWRTYGEPATEEEYLAQPHLTNDDLAITGLGGPRGLIS